MFKNFRESIPQKWMEKLDEFQRIIVLKCLRPDKITDAMQDYVAAKIGQRFIEPQVKFHLIIKYFFLLQSKIFHLFFKKIIKFQ